ncbi:ATP-binding protein [Streptomyces sp. NPDC001985]|uniref:ATP-binding protein n=1 Tax=Streptomyces sp. NPDC001985 TaxID=3154406 RepID=UPI00331A2842
MHEYTSTAKVWGLTCPGFPEEVSRARRWAQDILRNSPFADDAAVIVAELGTNAILHTASGRESGSFHLALAVSPQVVALSVTDEGGSAGTPRLAPLSDDAENGRGLGMVSELAHRMVIQATQGGHTVTAELLTEPNLSARQ